MASRTNKILATSTRVEDPIYQRSLTILSSATIFAYLVALRCSRARSSVCNTCPLWHVGLDRVSMVLFHLDPATFVHEHSAPCNHSITDSAIHRTFLRRRSWRDTNSISDKL